MFRLLVLSAALVLTILFLRDHGGSASRTARTDEVTARAFVIEGDTIEIPGTRIRLFGIDAPESGQTCETGRQTYRCGQRAALALDGLLEGRTVRCKPTGSDRYHRILARCRAGDTDV